MKSESQTERKGIAARYEKPLHVRYKIMGKVQDVEVHVNGHTPRTDVPTLNPHRHLSITFSTGEHVGRLTFYDDEIDKLIERIRGVVGERR